MGDFVQEQQKATNQNSDSESPGEQCSAPAGYQPVHMIGTGTFADIWLVNNATTQQQSVWKQLRKEWHQNATARQLLTNENTVLLSHTSPYVVKGVAQNSNSNELPGVLQDYISGQTLEAKMGAKPLPIPQAIWIARQAAQGIADLNNAGYTHGDIKASNIIVRPNGSVVLIDLGFSKSLQASVKQHNSCIMGTPEYLAPEVVSTEPQPIEMKDIYSLGVVLFKMLTGTLPFQGGTTASTLALARRHRSPLLQRWCPHAPDKLVRLLNAMLAKQPWRRPASIKIVIRELIELELAALSRRQTA